MSSGARSSIPASSSLYVDTYTLHSGPLEAMVDFQEHYVDSDLVDCSTPVAKVEAGRGALAVWGPPVPAVF